MVSQSLDDLGVAVRVAPDGEQALSLLKERLPNLLILDLMLPGIDGFEVLERLRELPDGGSVPVIVYTAKHISDVEKRRLNGGFVKVIGKGSDQSINSVVRCVSSTLGLSNTSDEDHSDS